jgi:hypothetical protein
LPTTDCRVVTMRLSGRSRQDLHRKIPPRVLCVRSRVRRREWSRIDASGGVVQCHLLFECG